MKIIYLSNNSRSSIGILQGLMKLNFEIKTSCDYISFGKTILKGNLSKTDFLNSDLIIASDVINSYKSIIEENNLWHKVINIDYRDTCKTLDYPCLGSFKRSLTNKDRELVVDLEKYYPIWHCALNEYYTKEHTQKYKIGCFFNLKTPDHLGFRRLNLISTLNELNLKNSLIGYSTGAKQKARLAISDPPNNNCFLDFLNLQNKCQIIFTAQPSHCEGDNRTWEAMASGALVFMDKTYHPMINPFEDKKHCFIYDASSKKSILDAIELALSLDDETIANIAQNGYEFVKKYHRPENRIRYIFHSLGIKSFV